MLAKGILMTGILLKVRFVVDEEAFEEVSSAPEEVLHGTDQQRLAKPARTGEEVVPSSASKLMKKFRLIHIKD
ncbi:hypothetical protein JCM31826_13310 [Thermaurantimonas aggregans]|uniref:Uncharacterized protein n=1 Tax=Thermaurantimonas aggregans TaxID=2173829 RepID=A0A401XLF3_9FLAO|nr:hypothetical protein JCM31826_13310 [Thermaurantimonas aggregans]